MRVVVSHLRLKEPAGEGDLDTEEREHVVPPLGSPPERSSGEAVVSAAG